MNTSDFPVSPSDLCGYNPTLAASGWLGFLRAFNYSGCRLKRPISTYKWSKISVTLCLVQTYWWWMWLVPSQHVRAVSFPERVPKGKVATGFGMAFSWRPVQGGEGILRKLWQVQIRIIRLLWSVCVLPDRSVPDFTDGYSNAEFSFLDLTAVAGLQGSPHTMSHCLFMGKYSLNCLYPALCHCLSLVKWVEVLHLGRMQSNIRCCEMAERMWVAGGGACWRR